MLYEEEDDDDDDDGDDGDEDATGRNVRLLNGRLHRQLSRSYHGRNSRLSNFTARRMTRNIAPIDETFFTFYCQQDARMARAGIRLENVKKAVVL